MDRDKAKVELKEAIMGCFKEGEIAWNRNGYSGNQIIDLMAEAALSVLLGIEDSYEYMKSAEIIK